MLMRLNKFSEKASKKIKNNEDKLMNKKVVVLKICRKQMTQRFLFLGKIMTQPKN